MGKWKLIYPDRTGAYTLENRVTFENRSGIATFECAGCGSNFKCEVGHPGQSNRVVCECGREYRIRYITHYTAEMLRWDVDE